MHPLQRSRKSLKSLKQQQGVVIVVALFIVALVATMSYVMLTRAARDTERTALLLRSTQAEFYAQGSIAWAIDQLSRDWEQQKPNQLIDNIPLQSPPDKMNGYKISSTIYDLQARFNLNNVQDAEAQQAFKSLLKTLAPKLTDEAAQQIVLGLVDWITPVSQENGFSKYYAGLTQPYRAAHRMMFSASELQLVKGITPAIYSELKPYIIALPEKTMLNVQTAPAAVLMTLSPALDLESAQAIEEQRKQSPILSPEVFASLDVVKNHQIKTDKIAVTSSYFLVVTDVSIENQHALLYTLLQRLSSGKKASLRIVWQSKSVWG